MFSASFALAKSRAGGTSIKSVKYLSLSPAIDLILAVVARKRNIPLFAAEFPRSGIFCRLCKKVLHTKPDTALKLYEPLALGKGLFHN